MAEQKNEQAQDINQLLKIRRDKLKELQENGKDPFTITKYDVTHHSQEIKDQFDAIVFGKKTAQQAADDCWNNSEQIFANNAG